MTFGPLHRYPIDRAFIVGQQRFEPRDSAFNFDGRAPRLQLPGLPHGLYKAGDKVNLDLDEMLDETILQRLDFLSA